MLTNNYLITSLGHDDIVQIISQKYNITLEESALVAKSLSFLEYSTLIEANVDRSNIPSPSGGSQIGGNPNNPVQDIAPNGNLIAQGNVKPNTNINTWDGDGDPELNSLISGADAEGKEFNGTAIGKNSDGTFKIRGNDGKEKDYTLADLTAITAAKNSNPFQKSLNAATSLMQSEDYSEFEINRILELAGIKETISCGATGAGSIASLAQPLGKMQKRKQAEEVTDKTIQGKIDPNAATGELSRRLADRNMKTASRTNNGFKK